MSILKPNPEIDERLEAFVIRQRLAIRRTEDIASLSEHPGWLAVVEDLRERLDSLETKLDNFENATPEARALHLKERKDFRLLVNLIEKASERLPGMYAELKENETKLNERKVRNGTVRS